MVDVRLSGQVAEREKEGGDKVNVDVAHLAVLNSEVLGGSRVVDDSDLHMRGKLSFKCTVWSVEKVLLALDYEILRFQSYL